MSGYLNAAVIALCFTFVQSAAQPQTKPAKPGQRQSIKGLPAQELKLEALFDDLGRVDSGTGVVILEPVGSGLDAETSQLMAGCSRWLQFVVGGHGEIGKTPSWDSIEQVRKELGAADLRLGLQDATRLGRILGVTHVVTGRVSGSPGKLALEYQVHLVRAGGGLIATVNVAGDNSQIIRALPGAAEKLARSLGVANPRVPPACTAGVSGLQLIGSFPWSSGGLDNDEPRKKLSALAARDPAAMTLVLTGPIDPDTFVMLKDTVDKLAPQNTIAAHLLAGIAGADTGYPAIDLAKLLERFPSNYLINSAMGRQATYAEQPMEEVKWARMAARCAPENSRAWSRVGDAYADLSENLRRGRTSGDITRDEWEALTEIYAYWTAAAQRAVRIDPKFAGGWLALAKAACFLSVQTELPSDAYWKAASLDPDSVAMLTWGLEMFQPKWRGDRESMDKVVAMCVIARYTNPNAGLQIAKHMGYVDQRYKPDWEKLSKRMESEARERLKSNPSDGEAHMALSTLAQWNKNAAEALHHALEAARQYPNNESNLILVSQFAVGTPSAAESIKLLQRAAEKRPASLQLGVALGRALYHEKRYGEAERVLRDVSRRFPDDPSARKLLASTLEGQDRPAESAAVSQQGIRLNSNDASAHVSRIIALRDAHDIDAALAACREARTAVPGDRLIRILLSELLQNKELYSEAIVELRYLVTTEQTSSRRATFEAGLAQSLNRTGQREEAIKAYRDLLKDDPDGALGALARNNLAELEPSTPDKSKSVTKQNEARADKPATSGKGGLTKSARPAGNARKPGTPATTQQKPAPTKQIVVPAPAEKEPVSAGGPPEKFIHASQLKDQGKWQEAIAEFREVLRLYPGQPGVHFCIGYCLIAAQKSPEAEPELRKALAEAPNDASVNYWLAMSILAQQRQADAVPFLRKAVESSPADVGQQRIYLSVLLNLKQTDQALSGARAAMAAIPGDASIREMLARALEQKGDEESALREYRQAQDECKEKAGPYYLMLKVFTGRLLWKMDKKDEARAEMRKVIELDTKNTGYGELAKQSLEMWK